MEDTKTFVSFRKAAEIFERLGQDNNTMEHRQRKLPPIKAKYYTLASSSTPNDDGTVQTSGLTSVTSVFETEHPRLLSSGGSCKQTR